MLGVCFKRDVPRSGLVHLLDYALSYFINITSTLAQVGVR